MSGRIPAGLDVRYTSSTYPSVVEYGLDYLQPVYPVVSVCVVQIKVVQMFLLRCHLLLWNVGYALQMLPDMSGKPQKPQSAFIKKLQKILKLTTRAAETD